MSPAVRRSLLLSTVLMAVVTAAGLALRPLLPIDETRYASVAWEMYLSGNWLVPHQNGLPYSDKPPLLFWLIVAGWRVVGPSGLWLRLVAPLAGLVALALTARLALRLWPGREGPAELAPLITVGALLWTVYASLTLFDTLLACAVLVTLGGLLMARRTPAGWAVVALGIAVGLFAKGPVILLHVVPVAMLAPWWSADSRPVSWSRWYLGLGLAVVGGAAVVLAWAVPAARAGGPDYADAIFLRQTAGRVVNAFAHRRPAWWYLPLVPMLALPWSLWPRLWRALGALKREAADPGVRFTIAYLAPVFLLFSLVSGKQIHYLVPLIPVTALLAARALDGYGPEGSAIRRCLALAAGSALVVAAVHAGAKEAVLDGYDLRPAARIAAQAEQRGAPVAFAGRYSGQFGWLGRLRRPLETVPDSAASAWLVAHPGGVLFRQVPGICPVGPAERTVFARRIERRTLCGITQR